MSVYVDSAFIAYRRMKMSHMIADTLDELHAMADTIGVARKWFQGKGQYPHYDVCKSRRELAIKAGATVLERRDFALKLREIRTCKYCGHRECRCPEMLEAWK